MRCKLSCMGNWGPQAAGDNRGGKGSDTCVRTVGHSWPVNRADDLISLCREQHGVSQLSCQNRISHQPTGGPSGTSFPVHLYDVTLYNCRPDSDVGIKQTHSSEYVHSDTWVLLVSAYKLMPSNLLDCDRSGATGLPVSPAGGGNGLCLWRRSSVCWQVISTTVWWRMQHSLFAVHQQVIDCLISEDRI